MRRPSSSSRPPRPLRLPRSVDPYVLALLGTVALAAGFPATGAARNGVTGAATASIAMLFFLYGARLAARETITGLRHWRLQTAIAASTFLVFPLLGLLVGPLLTDLAGPRLATGVVFLCLLPSTIQSSIAFTSIARGNVPAAVCAGTCSSLLGMLLTPLLAAALLGAQVRFDTTRLGALAGQIVLPFAAGQLARRWIGPALARHRRLLGRIDRASILLVVYTAFSLGTADGLWGMLTYDRWLVLLSADVLLLTAALLITSALGRVCGFDRSDRIALVFAGSKKSLVNAMPMASVLFGPASGAIVVPVMLFHQTQLIVCSVIAERWSRTDGPPPGIPASPSPAARSA